MALQEKQVEIRMEPNPFEFRFASLNDNPPELHPPPYAVYPAEHGAQPTQQPSSPLYTYSRRQPTFSLSPPFATLVSPIYARSSTMTVHPPSPVSPPAMGPGTWWYMPGQPPQPSNSIVPALPTSQPSWSPQQHSSTPSSPSPPSSNRFSRQDPKPLSRRAYHPSPPAARTEWVMWVGNIPGDAEHNEVWRFFTQPYESGRDMQPGGTRGKESDGVISIFLIPRSRCAFVNYKTDADLRAAIKRFNGASMRAADPRAARLLCRVRGNSDDLRAGVGGQRGTGLHEEWVKKQGESPKQASSQPSIASTPSNASTTASFLDHFPQRFFILKSLTQHDIDTSVCSGLWATQLHNEDILDRAFRTAKDVFLIFSVNKSGEFCGYARYCLNDGSGYRGLDMRRMQGRIGDNDDDNEVAVEWRPRAPVFVASPSPERPNKARTDSPAAGILIRPHSAPHPSLYNTRGRLRRGISPVILEPKYSLGQRRPIESTPEEEGDDTGYVVTVAQTQPAPQEAEEEGGKPPGKAEEDAEAEAELGWGRNFKLKWLSTVHLSFQHTRHIHNPWNRNREVKVSRDGTELEPAAGQSLLAEWKEVDEPATDKFPSPERPNKARTDTPAAGILIRPHSAPHPSLHDVHGQLRRGISPVMLGPRYSFGQLRPMESTPEEEGDDTGYVVTLPQTQPTPQEAKEEEEGMPLGKAEEDAGAEAELGWGRNFKLQWLSTEHIPFQNTRHINNPWNRNREVKVSRDGTEIEPAAGQLLLAEWK
ncbi:YT521-B-like domain-containing protein [Roridomyces roridus]|uniref:YT521-B-like domain-containing protein n=1 Tax=Roridomyces roridus TaxID=1738132 RepID=A0AAD7FJK5_9AGAR|nr:YT521-B-like domain-containing protein [Roridomyces roridus]